MADLSREILSTDRKIKRHPEFVRETPLERSWLLSELTGCQVYLKEEHLQRTGSFKFRGAMGKILSLDQGERERGVIAASSGNHGLGVALAAQLLQVSATVYVPATASPLKLKAIEALGAGLARIPGDCLLAETTAKQVAQEQGKTYISPYNDVQVIAGQGTIGLELYQQCPELKAVFVAVGGGGLIAGIGSYLKSVSPGIEIVGCWAENSPVMLRCLEAGKIVAVDEKPTLSDGTAGGLEPGAMTFSLCQQLIDGKVLASEREIAQAMGLLAETERWIVEGAAALALAGLLKEAGRYRGKPVAAVLCGRNITWASFLKAVTEAAGLKGQVGMARDLSC